jgi:mannitol/fructose-specific phosphotransferase system IIA component (Ntr-type)
MSIAPFLPQEAIVLHLDASSSEQVIRILGNQLVLDNFGEA